MNVDVFVDGFNVYHSISSQPELGQCKWLDYSRLVRRFIQPSWNLGEIFFFTSKAYWNREKVSRHDRYLTVLEDMGIRVIEGRFKHKSRNLFCATCRNITSHVSHEEKQTDVNIALTMLQRAYDDCYDAAFLISGDNDLVPAVRMIRTRFPGKEVHVILPLGRRAKELRQAATRSYQISRDALIHSILPDPYHHSSGSLINKPPEWI